MARTPDREPAQSDQQPGSAARPDDVRASPAELWFQAQREERDRAGSEVAVRLRYLELMREHGHIVSADHPDAGGRNLPCGWPGRD